MKIRKGFLEELAFELGSKRKEYFSRGLWKSICGAGNSPNWPEYSAYVGKWWDIMEFCWISPCQSEEFIFNFLERKVRLWRIFISELPRGCLSLSKAILSTCALDPVPSLVLCFCNYYLSLLDCIFLPYWIIFIGINTYMPYEHSQDIEDQWMCEKQV